MKSKSHKRHYLLFYRKERKLHDEKSIKSIPLIIDKLILPITLFACTILIKETIEYNPKNKVPIILGMTNHSILLSDTQTYNNQSAITDLANELLGARSKKYLFIPTIIGGKYKNIIPSLEYNRIDIAFFSPYLYYTCRINNKEYLNHFRLIGFKYTNSGINYTTGLICSKKLNYKSVKAITTDIYSLKVKVGIGNESSASTMAIPQLFLLRNGIRTNDSIRTNQFIYLDRRALIEQIQKSPNEILGFISSNDWLELQRLIPTAQLLFDYFEIKDFPIPYDPVMVHKKYWTKFMYSNYFSKILDIPDEEKIILGSLRNYIYTDVPTQNDGFQNDWTDKNQNFLRLLNCGVISKLTTDTFRVDFINDDVHLKLVDEIKKMSNKNKYIKCNIVSLLPSKKNDLFYPYELVSKNAFTLEILLNSEHNNTILVRPLRSKNTPPIIQDYSFIELK